MLIDYQRGQTSITVRVKLFDSSANFPTGLTGLTSASAGLRIAATADNEPTATAYTAAGSTIETISTLGTYATPTATKCRFKEFDATNHPGWYELHFADARFAVTNAKSLGITISGATNLVQCDVTIPLRDINPYDSVRYGMTALPNAAAGGAGGLPPLDGSGNLNVAVTKWIDKDVPVADVDGVPNVSLKYILGDAYPDQTSSLTSNGSTTLCNDTARTEATNSLKGRTVRWITGPNAGLVSVIASNVASTSFTVVDALTSTTTGDQYELLPTAPVFLANGAQGGSSMTLTTGNVSIGGTLGVTGTTTLAALTTTGTVTMNALTVSGVTSLTGAVILGSTLSVGGATTFSGGVTLSSTLTVSGATSFAGISTSGTVSLNALAVTTTTTLTGNVSLGGTLTVSGATSLAALSTSGTTTLNALTVTNATTLTGAFTATNAGNDVRGISPTGTATLAESYAADGAAATMPQLLYQIVSMLGDYEVVGTTLTTRKIDGSTTAMTFTLDDATNPTSITRAS